MIHRSSLLAYIRIPYTMMKIVMTMKTNLSTVLSNSTMILTRMKVIVLLMSMVMIVYGDNGIDDDSGDDYDGCDNVVEVWRRLAAR